MSRWVPLLWHSRMEPVAEAMLTHKEVVAWIDGIDDAEMQTFLPYADFTKSARCLDDKRLGKQRVEAFQIINVLTVPEDAFRRTIGWVNHPVTCMWRGHLSILIEYYHETLKEWMIRGYENNLPFFARHEPPILSEREYGFWPPWLGLPDFHASHRQTLLAKNYAWYSQFGWAEQPKYRYFWPITSKGYGEWGPEVELDTANSVRDTSLDSLTPLGGVGVSNSAPSDYWNRFKS